MGFLASVFLVEDVVASLVNLPPSDGQFHIYVGMVMREAPLNPPYLASDLAFPIVL